MLSEDFIAREGKYNHSCKVDFTRCNYTEKEEEVPQSSKGDIVCKEFEVRAFEKVVTYCHSLINECLRAKKFNSHKYDGICFEKQKCDTNGIYNKIT